jgi:hypothetical protein
MGLFDRIFGRGKQKVAYPSDLRPEIERAMSGLQVLTAAHDRMWQLGQAAWSVDQDAGTITFTSPQGIIATAPVQFVGSYNSQGGTWLWAWSNPSLEATLTEHAAQVRSFGQERGYEILTTPKLACPEEQCWELAALACKLAGAQGAYRGPAGAIRVFMTFGEVRLNKAS